MQWIDVMQSQPGALEDVLVVHQLDGEPQVDLAYIGAEGRWYLTGVDGLELDTPPTHWMRLPEPPVIVIN